MARGRKKEIGEYVLNSKVMKGVKTYRGKGEQITICGGCNNKLMCEKKKNVFDISNQTGIEIALVGCETFTDIVKEG